MSKIKFGFGNEITKPYATLGDLKEDKAAQAVLGFGDNVDFYVNGVLEDDDNRRLLDSDEVSVQTRTSTKRG